MNSRGSRDLFAEVFPEGGEGELTVAETRLLIEGYQYHTSTAPTDIYAALPFYEAQGDVAPGLNLDGEVGAEDFANPAGEDGIDNQLNRVLGCIAGYRKDGPYWFFENDFMINNGYNRWMIELTGVDDLVMTTTSPSRLTAASIASSPTPLARDLLRVARNESIPVGARAL